MKADQQQDSVSADITASVMHTPSCLRRPFGHGCKMSLSTQVQGVVLRMYVVIQEQSQMQGLDGLRQDV